MLITIELLYEIKLMNQCINFNEFNFFYPVYSLINLKECYSIITGSFDEEKSPKNNANNNPIRMRFNSKSAVKMASKNAQLFNSERFSYSLLSFLLTHLFADGYKNKIYYISD